MTKQITILNDDIKLLPQPYSKSKLLRFAIFSKDKQRVKFLSSGNVYHAYEVMSPSPSLLKQTIVESLFILKPIVYFPNRRTSLNEVLAIETAFVEHQRNKLVEKKSTNKFTEKYYNF